MWAWARQVPSRSIQQGILMAVLTYVRPVTKYLPQHCQERYTWWVNMEQGLYALCAKNDLILHSNWLNINSDVEREQDNLPSITVDTVLTMVEYKLSLCVWTSASALYLFPWFSCWKLLRNVPVTSQTFMINVGWDILPYFNSAQFWLWLCYVVVDILVCSCLEGHLGTTVLFVISFCVHNKKLLRIVAFNDCPVCINILFVKQTWSLFIISWTSCMFCLSQLNLRLMVFIHLVKMLSTWLSIF